MRLEGRSACVVGSGTRRVPRAGIGAAAGLLAMAIAGPATAQVATTGTISVIVEDEGGGRVPGAAVTADAVDSVTRRIAVSDERGEAALRQLDPSAGYVLTVALAGFRTAKRPDVLVRAGQTTTLHVGLVVGSLSEELTVTAETPLVDTTNAATGQDVTLQLAESLPTGRSYQSYLQLVPGVLPSSGDGISRPDAPAARSGTNYVGGTMGRSQDNFYYIDGVNVTDGASGRPFANLNPEVVQEQQVLTGGLSAEFVGAPGLISNVITKSGSDELHGSLNYFFQSSSLVAENENAPEQRFSTFDAAATLGGPIIKSKLWFFASRHARADAHGRVRRGLALRPAELGADHEGHAEPLVLRRSRLLQR